MRGVRRGSCVHRRRTLRRDAWPGGQRQADAVKSEGHELCAQCA